MRALKDVGIKKAVANDDLNREGVSQRIRPLPFCGSPANHVDGGLLPYSHHVHGRNPFSLFCFHLFS